MDTVVVNPVENEGRLARIETKLDIHLAQQALHETRIKWLETKVNYFLGCLAVINVLIGLWATKIIRVLNV